MNETTFIYLDWTGVSVVLIFLDEINFLPYWHARYYHGGSCPKH